MTDEREFEGKVLEEALDQAAAALGVSQDDLHYEILEAGRRGLLGLGVKNVRIRVKPPIETELDREEPDDKPARARRPGKQRASRSSRGPRRKAKAATSNAAPSTPAKNPAEPVDAALVPQVEGTLAEMIQLMGLELEAAAEPSGEGVQIKLQGPDEAMLIARNAELLSAIQFLLNRMSRRAWPGVGRISVTCNGHAKPRDDELFALTRKVAEQVERTGKTKKLRPMNAYERRLVHLTVREFSGLTSSSDGHGTLKRVRISKVQNQI